MVIAFGMRSTIDADTGHRKETGELREQKKRESGVTPSPLTPTGSVLRQLLTSVEVFLVLGLVVSGVPMVVFTVLAHLDHEDILVVVPLVALHS